MRLRRAAWGLFVALGVGCSWAGCGFEEMSGATAEVSKALDALFQSTDEASWAAQYQSATSEDFRKACSKEEYHKLGRAVHDRLGKLQSKDLKGSHVRSMNGVVSADVTYEAQFEKGKGTIAAGFIKTEGRWLLVSFRVNSPLFLEPATVPCGSCGKPRPLDAAFCPACGRKVEAAPAAPEQK